MGEDFHDYPGERIFSKWHAYTGSYILPGYLIVW